MSYRRKSWQEKLVDKKGFPRVLKFEKSFPCYNAVHKMGAEIGDEVVLLTQAKLLKNEKMPKGKLITIVEICWKSREKTKSRLAVLSRREFSL